jgi:hypothetical protein
MNEFIEKLIGRLEERKKAWTVKGIVFSHAGGTEIVDEMAFGTGNGLHEAIEIINQLAEEYNNGWIAFTQRELTEEEKEHYGNEIKYMLDCKLPEEDEEILVTYKWKDKFYVGNDTFLRDGSECYLDSGREFITEAIAWQSLPAPYEMQL